MKLLRNALLSLLFASFFNSSNAIEANGFEPQKAAFQENKGQVTGTDKDRVQFVYTNENLSIFLLENGLAYQFSKPSDKGEPRDIPVRFRAGEREFQTHNLNCEF
jgi:hypothetical protein